MKLLSRTELAKRFLNLREIRSDQEAITALAHLLVAQGMSDKVDSVVKEIGYEQLRRNKTLAIELTSAFPLSNAAVNEVTDIFKKRTGAIHTSVTQNLDPTLLGGITARALDYELDYSLSRRLQQLET